MALVLLPCGIEARKDSQDPSVLTLTGSINAQKQSQECPGRGRQERGRLCLLGKALGLTHLDSRLAGLSYAGAGGGGGHLLGGGTGAAGVQLQEQCIFSTESSGRALDRQE